VDLFEYQARDLFEKHGVPVLAAAIATTADEAEAAATKIGGKVVVKAQVKVGGRGKSWWRKACRKSSRFLEWISRVTLFAQ
jgi:succinyl-CoA synthetase beta subunit